MKLTTQEEYFLKVKHNIEKMFSDEDENGIQREDLNDPEKVKMLLHVISTVYPNHLYSNFTQEDISNLEYNQLANRLCFEFCERT